MKMKSLWMEEKFFLLREERFDKVEKDLEAEQYKHIAAKRYAHLYKFYHTPASVLVKKRISSAINYTSGLCPTCGRVINFDDFANFCSFCGQALDWKHPEEIESEE